MIVIDKANFMTSWYLDVLLHLRNSFIMFELNAAKYKEEKILTLTSHGILHYLWSEDLPKSFSQLIMSIFIFSQYFFQYILSGGNIWGYPTLLISRFINFKKHAPKKFIFYSPQVKHPWNRARILVQGNYHFNFFMSEVPIM